MDTIAVSRKDNGNMESLQPIKQKFLRENKDVMPDYLPKNLPPRREVDHRIKLEARAKPPTHAPYRMAPPELGDLRKHLKEILEVGHPSIQGTLWHASAIPEEEMRVVALMC